ncbi:MAG: hypothetical protein K8T20_01230, partial [Planctomycetes bacterium]|nr:hypothetical protein [Planctomycetota bacterium]
MRPVTALLLFLFCSPAFANREGWANARQKAERLERRSEFADATVWWEAAAETLEVVSAPLSELGMAEAKEDGDEGAFAWWKEYGEEDKKLAAEARERAKTCAAKAGKIPEETRTSVRQFIDGWIVQDPEQFWSWGRFERRLASRRAAGDPVGALELEAKARNRWAARYTKICVPYWKARGNEKQVAEYTNRAGEQEKLAREALDRATDTAKRDGWEPEALRTALRSGTPEEQQSAVERLAMRGDVASLRLALECPEEKARGLAVAKLIRANDLPTLALPRDSKVAKSVQEELKLVEAVGSPEFHVALLAGLSSNDAGVSDACAEILTRVLGRVPEGAPA